MNIIFISLLMLHCYACCTDSDLITSQGVLVCTLRSTRAALYYKFCYGDGQLWYIDCGLVLLIVTPMKRLLALSDGIVRVTPRPHMGKQSARRAGAI